MSVKIPFTFGLSPLEPAITSDSDVWSTQLPLDMSVFQGAPAKSDQTPAPTYGDYFQAAQNFLLQDDMALLCRAAGKVLGRVVDFQDIEGVGIYLVKHGALYHPARIDVSVTDRCVALVLNVAVSARGRQVLSVEFEAVSRLAHELARGFWPSFYGYGSGKSADGRFWPMLLGRWLEGFYEFHLADSTVPGPMTAKVWDSDRGHWHLTPHQQDLLIGKAAEILTYAYNPLTFEAILDWHHAAGDFIVRPLADGIDVRLITVRDYAPIVITDTADVEAVLDAMVAFVVDMSLRLRLDRLQGVGRMACYPRSVISAIWTGFCKGLRAAAVERGLPNDFADDVVRFFKLQGIRRLTPIAKSIMEKYPASSETRDLLQRIYRRHLDALWAAVSA
jgi:dihydroneopterin aldolase